MIEKQKNKKKTHTALNITHVLQFAEELCPQRTINTEKDTRIFSFLRASICDVKRHIEEKW